jgi:hypothetical protein
LDHPNVGILLEIGPPGMLPQLVAEMEQELGLPQGRVQVISTMCRPGRGGGQNVQEAPPQLLKAIGQLWQASHKWEKRLNKEFAQFSPLTIL